MSLLDDAYLTLTTGAKGSGKTAFLFYQGEKIHERGYQVCFMPYKEVPHKLLPKWIQQTDPDNPNLVPHTAYICDDWHLVEHALYGSNRRKADANKVMSIARHNDMKFFISTQITRQITISDIYDIDVHFLRKPAANHAKMERPEVKDRVREAQDFFIEEMERGVNPNTLVYYYTLDDSGFIRDVPLPSFWSEELSTYLKQSKRNVRRKI